MKKGNRVIRLAVSVAALALLTGCGMLNDYVSEQVAAESENAIQNSAEYRQYKQYKEEGLLAENGLYATPEPQPADDPTENARKVRVTIAKNSFLDCTFYTDEQSKEPIESSEVWLAPGECLYCANVTVNNPVRLYDFSCFRIWSYDQNGERSTEPYDELKTQNGRILKIPDRFTGTGFSIEPIGVYTNREITARAYFMQNGKEAELPNGKWTVNGKVFDKTSEISPVESYTIVYDYSAYKNDFYYVSSSPSCWYSKESDNTVIFREVSSTEPEKDFSVEMHPFVTLTVKNLSKPIVRMPLGNNGESIIKTIQKEGKTLCEEKWEEKSFDIKELRVAETVSIRVGKEYKIVGKGVNVGTPIPLGSDAENGYEYSIVIPDTNKGISIEIAERNSQTDAVFLGYNMANADITIIRANGTELRLGDELPSDNEKVELVITPRTGYYVTDKEDDNYCFRSKKMEFKKLEGTIQSVIAEHTAKPFITLNLVFEDELGSYSYTLDGKPITSSPVTNARIGQKLKVRFTANDEYRIDYGWFGGKTFSDVKALFGSLPLKEITADMDNTIIDWKTFDLHVEKRGDGK